MVDLLELIGEIIGVMKCILGNGTKFILCFSKSVFNYPGKRMLLVMPERPCATKLFKSANYGELIDKFLEHLL